jgi:lysophospholipase L1-like esterase
LKPYGTFGAAIDMMQFRMVPDMSKVYTVDPDFGFRPLLGNEVYSDFGTLVNDYPLAKREGITRLLFLGDSVTARGEMVNAFAECCGEERYEYWNAGVESFNTLQEVRFYAAYNRAISPDHVILTLHNNDLQTTPIAFREGQRLVVYAPGMAQQDLSPWLFRHSYVYRAFLGARLSFMRQSEPVGSAIVNEVRTSLAELSELVEDDGAKLSVILFPVLKPVSQWSAVESESRKKSLEILNELDIAYFDLMDDLLQSLAAGIEVQYQPGDTWHPSAEASQLFVESLISRGLLQDDPCALTPRPLPPPGPARPPG